MSQIRQEATKQSMTASAPIDWTRPVFLVLHTPVTCRTPTWNISRTGAPPRRSGAAGPGRLLTSRLTSRWRGITPTIQRCARRPTDRYGGSVLRLAVAAAMLARRRTGSASPTDNGAIIMPTRLPTAR